MQSSAFLCASVVDEVRVESGTESRRRHLPRHARGRAARWSSCSSSTRPAPRSCSAWARTTPGGRSSAMFRPGFFRKVRRTSVLSHYGLMTLLYGTLLPGPDIGRRCADTLRAVRDAGFEVGIHAWDHVKWQDGVGGADAAWTRRQMELAVQRFQEIFGSRAQGARRRRLADEPPRLPADADAGVRLSAPTRAAAGPSSRSTRPRSSPARSCRPPCPPWTS